MEGGIRKGRGGLGRGRRFLGDDIGENTDAVDLDTDTVAGFQPARLWVGRHADAMWPAGENHRAGQQRALPLRNWMMVGTSKIKSPVFHPVRFLR